MRWLCAIGGIVVATACGRLNFDPVDDTGETTQPLCIDGWCWEYPLPQGDTIYGMHGTGPDDIWAVGGRGLAMHYDGTSWTIDHAGVEELHGVFSTADEVWALGFRGAIAHRDSGGAWTLTTAPDDPVNGTPDINAGWGSSPNNIWGACESAAVVHYDGSAWTTQPLGAVWATYWAMWGTAPNDMWVIGDGHTYHYDGTTFSNAGLPTGVQAIGWGSGPNDVWVGDVNGGLHQFDGTSWATVGSDQQYSFSAGWSQPGETWAAAYGELAHGSRNGVTDATFDGLAVIFAFWGTGSDLWMGGEGGRLYHYDGSAWSPYYDTVAGDLYAITGTGPDMWAVGRNSFLHRDANGWQHVDTNVTDIFYDAWAAGPDAVFLAGAGGIYRWNGVTLTLENQSAPNQGVVAISGTSATDVWALRLLSGAYELLHNDGVSWAPVPTGVTGSYSRAIEAFGPGDVWLAVDNHVLHSEGGSWIERVTLPATEFVVDIAGTGPNDLYVLCGQKLFYWDGATLTSISESLFAGRVSFQGMYRRSATELLLVAGEQLFVWDGTTMVEQRPPTSNGLAGIWGDGTHEWIVGLGGSILRR